MPEDRMWPDGFPFPIRTDPDLPPDVVLFEDADGIPIGVIKNLKV